jgi:hypothetical protein
MLPDDPARLWQISVDQGDAGPGQRGRHELELRRREIPRIRLQLATLPPAWLTVVEQALDRATTPPSEPPLDRPPA